MPSMLRQVTPNRLSAYAIAGLVILALLFWADCLFGPNTPLAAGFQAQMEPWRSECDLPGTGRQWSPLLWDGVAQFYPWRLLAARAMRRGELALWNRHQFCGYPFVGTGQSALFYPPNWLLALVDVKWSMGLLAALHYALAACLTWTLGRRIGLGRVPAAFAGIAFAWGGFMVTWTELPTLMNCAAWLPGALLGVALVFERSRWGVPVLVVSLAMSLLAGHFQIAAYVWLTAVAYALVRVAWEAVNHRPSRVAALAAGVAVAGLLAGAQVLPTLELGANSPRGGGRATEAGWQFHQARALQPGELMLLLRPDALGNPAHGDHQLTRYGIPYSEHCGFVGVVTLVLALAGIALARTRHFAFFIVLAAATLSIAMGGPLARAMYFGVPKLGQAGGFTRILSVFTFAAAMSGGLGLQALCRRLGGGGEGDHERERRPGRRLSASTVASVAAVAILLYELLPWAYDFLPKTRREHVYPLTPAIERLIQTDGRVLAVTPREGWTMARAPEAVLPPNSATVYGYESIGGYDSLMPRSYRAFLAEAEGADPAPAANGNMLLPEEALGAEQILMGISAVLSRTRPEPPPGRQRSTAVHLAGGHGGVSLYEPMAALPRAFRGPPWPYLARSWSLSGPQGVLGGTRPCPWRRVGNGVISVSIPGGRFGWDLCVTETFYPGWNAYVDGEPRTVHPYAGTFCGVSLNEGDSEVRLVFEPTSVRVGIFLSLLALGLLAGAAVGGRRARRDTRD
ncbi:MAG: YfhO family protein [Armatimonadota bacterium]